MNAYLDVYVNVYECVYEGMYECLYISISKLYDYMKVRNV